MMGSSPEYSSNDLVSQSAQLSEHLQLGVGDVVFFSRDCWRLPWKNAAVCYVVKALFGEWDHVAVVVEMDRMNCGGKGNDGNNVRNNRKLILLEASKTVVARDLIQQLERTRWRRIGVRRLTCLRSERLRQDAESFATSVIGLDYKMSLSQFFLSGVRNHPPKERRRKAQGNLLREKANQRHLKNMQEEIFDPVSRYQVEMELLDSKRSEQALINALEARSSALENEADNMSSLFCSELIAALYQRLGLLPTSTPPNDYSPIDFSSYGMTGKRSRLHLMMGSYLEPMVLLKNEGKICDVAAARQLPGGSNNTGGIRKLGKGERFASESESANFSPFGYEIMEGDTVVSMDLNKEREIEDDGDDSSSSQCNAATVKLKKGDCFGSFPSSWSAVAGEEGVSIRPVLRQNIDRIRRSEWKLVSNAVRLGAVFDRFVDDGGTMSLSRFCEATHLPVMEGFIRGKKYQEYHPAGEMAYMLAKEVGTGTQVTRSGFIEVVGDILGPGTTAEALDALSARASNSSSPGIKEYLTEENIADFRRLWKDDSSIGLPENPFSSSSFPALWDIKLPTQLTAWAAAVIAVSPLNHATLMAQCGPRPESAPLSIHGKGKWRGSPFLASCIPPAIVGSCIGFRSFSEYLQSCGNAKETSAVIAGGITGLITGVLLTPLELIFARHASGNVRLLEAIRLLSSSGTTLVRAAPLSACWGLVFGGVLGLGAAVNTKDSLSKMSDVDHVLHHEASQRGRLYEAVFLIKAAWANGEGRDMVCAAGIATLLAHPFDAARKRLALQGFSNPSPLPRSISYIRGAPGNILRVSLAAAMAWTFGMTKELKYQ